MADITLTDEQLAALQLAAEPVLALLEEYQDRYINTEFKLDEEPFDPDGPPPSPHEGKPDTYLQVLTTRVPLPGAAVGQIPGPVAPNHLDDHPADQRFSPSDLKWLFPKMPFAFQVFSKEGEHGPYYAVNFLLRCDGNLFRFTKNIFPWGDPPEVDPWRFIDEKDPFPKPPCD